MALFRRLQRWLEDPLRSELEAARRDLAIATLQLEQVTATLREKMEVVAELRSQLTNTLRLVADLKRAGFVSEPTLNRPTLAPVEESEEEQQLWAAIYQRAPRGSSLAGMLYQHAQVMLAQDETIEHVIGTILEGGAIDTRDLEEDGA